MDLTPFERIRVFAKGGLRAPHKPLLILFALARLKVDGQKRIRFIDIEKPVGDIIRAYAPPGSQARAQDPFRYLESDGFWEIQASDRDALFGPSNGARITELRGQDVSAGFTKQWLECFRADSGLIDQVALLLLNQHFPASLHEEILERVGLELGEQPAMPARKRNRAFVVDVREAYFGQCAFCGFDLRFGGESIALEAAHIQWHALGGVDEVWNGLALCALHHKLFDKGVLTIDLDQRIQVSVHLEGPSARRLLSEMDAKPLASPRSPEHLPRPEVLRWHHRQVFKSKGGLDAR